MSDDNKQLASEEVKAKVVEEYGFSEDTHKEQIEKLTNERLEHQKELSKAIDKKAAYRDIGVEAGILDPKTFEPIKKEPDGNNLNKPNTQSGLSEDRLYAKMYAKGYEDEEIDMAFKIAKLNNIPLDEALKDDYLLAKVEGRKQKELSKKAQLAPAHGGSPINQEIPTDREEHRKVYEETMRKAGLR